MTPPPFAPRPAPPQSSRNPYAIVVGVLSIASTLIAVFDLSLFAAGLGR